MRCVLACFILSLLPFVVSYYEDLGHLCTTGRDKTYKSVQPKITYSATPYPFVKNDTVVTLTCTGHSIHGARTGSGDLSYMTDVEFLSNGNSIFHSCREEAFFHLRRLSCNVSVSHVTNDDKFWCIIRASKAPCNVAQIRFHIGDILPKPERVYLKKVTSGKAVIGWKSISANTSVYGVLLGYNLTITGKGKNEDITLPSNASDVVFQNLIRKSNYTVRLRGFTQYGEGSVLEYNFTTLDIIPAPANVKVIRVMENSVVIQWNIIEQKKEKRDELTSYRVTIKNQTYSFHVKTSRNVSSISISHLLPNSNYNVSVVGLNEGSEGIPSAWIRFKTRDLEEEPPSTDPVDDRNEIREEQSNSTLTIVLPVILAAGILAVMITLAIFGFRRRNQGKISYNVEFN